MNNPLNENQISTSSVCLYCGCSSVHGSPFGPQCGECGHLQELPPRAHEFGSRWRDLTARLGKAVLRFVPELTELGALEVALFRYPDPPRQDRIVAFSRYLGDRWMPNEGYDLAVRELVSRMEEQAFGYSIDEVERRCGTRSWPEMRAIAVRAGLNGTWWQRDLSDGSTQELFTTDEAKVLLEINWLEGRMCAPEL